MDRNFVSILRSLPFWPNNLIPLDEIFARLLKTLGVDDATAQTLDPGSLIGGLLGVRDIELHRYDGVTTVTGDIVVGSEMVLAPFQSYLGIVLGDTSPGITTFPFALTLKDEPPTKNNDKVFFFDPNPTDPQLGAFQPIETNPDAGFRNIGSWELRLRNIPAKVRLLKGVTRVEQIDPADPGRGFRDLPDEHVDAGIEISLNFDAEGNLELWPLDPMFSGVAGDPVAALDIELGLFRISGSSLVLSVSGLGYHRADTPFPTELEVPAGLDQTWAGFVAEQIGGFWAKVPTEPGDEHHIYGIQFENLLIGNDVFSVAGSFVHGGGPNDPFASTTPVAEADLPASRYSLRRIEVWVTDGVGDFLQFGGQLVVAAILDFFDFQPVQFEVSLGRVVKQVEGIDQPLPFVELQGSLAPVQNHFQPTPDGQLRLPIVDGRIWKLNGEINAVRFTLMFPGGEVPGQDVPTVVELKVDLNIEIGNPPAVIVGTSGVGFRYTTGVDRFKPLIEGIWLETKKISPLNIEGYQFSVSRISFGFDSGDLHAYWLGFDAHLEFPDSLGRSEVYGMKFGWNDDDALFSIDGIGITVKKPTIEFVGIVRFLDGSASFVPEGEEPITIQDGSLSGLVKLAFPAADIPFSFEVGLMHGKYVRDAVPDDERSFWMLSAELVFPAGIPLGFLDLAFYGIAMAFGSNVAPRKAADTSWFDWYAKELPTYNVIAPTKWTAAHGRSAYGFGAVLGSLVKSGFPHNERALFLLNTASESVGSMWMIEGKIRFLKQVTASGKPNIAILFVWAPDQVLFRAEFHFSFPAEGNAAEGLVLTARAMIEVFIDRTPAGRHHIYLGRNQPYSERINASAIAGFFTARAFYMLDWQDLPLSAATLPALAFAFGFSQSWELDKKFGPLHFYLEAGIELEVGFSFASGGIGAFYGFLHLYGGLGLRLWGFGFGLSVDAAFVLFVSDGWSLAGNLRIKLNLPWPIPDYKRTLKFDWGPGANPPITLRSPLIAMALSSPSIDGDAAVHEWSEDNVLSQPAEFDPARSEMAVDGSVLLAFRAPAGNKVPWVTGTDVRPVDGSGEWLFRYTLNDLMVTRRLPGTDAEPLPDTRKRGFWEIGGMTATNGSAPTDDVAPLSQTVRIWGDLPGEHLKNMGDLSRSGAVTWLDGFLDRFGTWPCGPDVDLNPICVHFDLVSFRVLDDANTRATILPNGTSIHSRPLFNPALIPEETGFFATLDQVIANPRPNLWSEHDNVLQLPYLYASPGQFNKELAKKMPYGPMPIISALDVDVPPSTEVTVTIVGVLPAEAFVLLGFHESLRVATSAIAVGSGLHVLTVSSPEPLQTINRIRILSVNRFSVSDTGNLTAVSVVGSMCYRTAEQVDLHEHVIDQRSHLDSMAQILTPPSGAPGENADAFNLHAQGTEYAITPVVTCERRGPDGGWEIVHDQIQLATARVTVGAPPADLRPYLDETIPTANQDPVYLDDDMILRFNRSYGPEMYTVSGFDFAVEILDSQRQPVPSPAEWRFSEKNALTPAQEVLLEQLNASPCITADLSAIRKKLEYVIRPEVLPRNYYYMVIRSSAHEAPLYEATFSTSQYNSFDQQYAELANNVLHELLPRAVHATVFQDLLTSFAVTDRDEENNALETAWEDGLGLSFREQPARGELIVMYEPEVNGPGAPRAILIDSPEPMLVDGRTALAVTLPAGATESHQVLRSADGSRTLIFAHDGQSIVNLPIGTYALQATYRREVDGLPTQRVSGSSAPSTLTVSLEVTVNTQVLWEEL